MSAIDFAALELKLRANFLPIGLLVGSIVALSCPSLGASAASASFQNPFGSSRLQVVPVLCVVAVFLVQGLTLNTDDLQAALRVWRASAFGVVSILLVTPLVGLVYGGLTMLDPSFRVGLILFVSMPTTINSGIVLTTAAGGSAALALLLTLASSFVGVFTTPFVLAFLLSVGGAIRINPWPLLATMVCEVLVPLAAGKLLRESSHAVHDWVRRRKPLLSYVSQGAICVIPWLTLSADAGMLWRTAGET